MAVGVMLAWGTALLVSLPAQAQTPVVEAKNADTATVLQANEDGGLLGLGVLGTGVIPAEGLGTRLMWHPAKAAFRAGILDAGGPFADGSEWNDANVGTYSVAFGRNTIASGLGSAALGGGTQATGANAIASGASTVASGGASFAMGFETQAMGRRSMAVGNGAIASGEVSIALGRDTEASGNDATAMGIETMASGDGATAMGSQTTASGDRSVAMGFGSEASGLRATAMGQSTTASGQNAVAMGFQTTAQAYGSLVIGRHNVIAGNPNGWSSPDPLFVAGNGTGNASRSNALTLFKDGNLTIAGNLTQNSDRRLKTDITPLKDVRAALDAIQPVRYRFKDQTTRPAGPQIGLIAQEVQQAFPELVTRGADGYLSVAYPKLTAVLLRGLQEQQTEIEALRMKAHRVDALETRLALVEARVQDEASVLAGWTGWGAVGLLAVLVLGGLLIRRRQGALLAAMLVAGLWTMPAGAQTPVMETTNADEATVLQVNEDGGLLGLGVFGTGVIPAEGPGTRLMWHPAKAAFRAGRVGVSAFSLGQEWNDTNVGNHSVAFGRDAEASGEASAALNYRTTASGEASAAMGSNTTASGFAATAMGFQTTAGGIYSFAAGRRAMVRTEDSGTFAWADSEDADFPSTGPNQFLIRAAGGVGIGTNRPNFQLSLGDKLSHTKIALYETSSTNHYGMGVVAGQFSFHLNQSGARYAFYDSDTQDREIVTFEGSGNVRIAGSLTENSDRRLKTDITPLGPALDRLLAIAPVRYRFKSSTSRPAEPQIGLIAQEVGAAFPELVTRGTDGYLAVAYPKLTAVLLKGLQEQQARIGAQQAEIDALQTKARQVGALEARLALLEARVQDAPSVIAGWSGWGTAGLLVLLVLGGLLLRRRYGLLIALGLGMGFAALPAPAQAQTIAVQNGATLRLTGGGTLDLHGATLTLGSTGETAQLEETGGGRVTGGRLTATRVLLAPSGVDVAGLGALLTSSQALGATTVTRGHTAQEGGGNKGIERYYDIAPTTNSGLDATLVVRYADAELGSLPESELEFYRSTDDGATWQRRGADSRDPDANTVTLAGIDAFSRWTLAASSQPLPVELTAFEAALNGDAVLLTWTTASETNNVGFAVERRPESERRWTTVGRRAGAGTTDQPQTYRFVDADLPYATARLLYRLRQTDVDGTEHLSAERVVVRAATDRLELKAPFPNPVRGSATVRFAVPEDAGGARLVLVDLLGRAVRSVDASGTGRQEITLHTSGLASGVYFLRLTGGPSVLTQRVMVVR